MFDIVPSIIEETYGGDLDSTDDPGASVQSGGAFINEGTYGCAFSPPLPCTDPRLDPDPSISSIGKIFSVPSAFLSEMKEIKKIKRFDPKFDFTVPYVSNCIVNSRHFQPSDQINKCKRHIKPNVQLYSQLMYKYGGIDLANLYEFPKKYPIELDILLRRCFPVFKGLQRMGATKHAHADIKPPNMLIDLTTNPQKVYLIDFGLLTKFKDLKSHFYLHEHRYPYYPPEFRIFDSHRKGIFQTRTILQMCLDNFTYLNSLSFIRWISKRWPSYSLDLQTTIQSFQAISFSDFVKDFDLEIAPKLDTYSLGITLLEIIYRYEVFLPVDKKVLNQAFFEECIQSVLLPMIHPNVYSRIPIDEAIVRFERLVKTYPDATLPPPPPVPKRQKMPRQSKQTQPQAYGPNAHPIVVTPSPTRSPSPPSPQKPSPVTMEKCMKYKVVDLQEFMEKHQLPKYGKKQILCERLIRAMNQKHGEHKLAQNILKKVAKHDKKTRRPMAEPIPPPHNEMQREIDRLYIKPLMDCNKTERDGAYPIKELREIARQLRLRHVGKREEICKELQELRMQNP